MDEAHKILKSTFGYPGFRGVQQKVIERLLIEKKNALCLMPTGGGKSLCFQVPALVLDGLTLVVSPLIALMKDQVDVLRAKGVAAASMDSSLSIDESAAVKRDLREGRLKILYVAPERLANEMFVSMIKDQTISLLAVDESHCVSEWGPSFRAEYLKVSRFAKEIEAERVLCLTATATPSVVKDICAANNGFDIDLEHGVFSTGAFRPNLSLQIKPCANYRSKVSVLAPFLRARGDGAAIVYVTVQKTAEELATELKETHKIDARAYHAGMTSDKRKEVQDWFIRGSGVVVATIAFGMGIDKANIRAVVHFSMPKTLENYSQEIGRAGRDGLPSTCLMLPSSSDLPILESFARANTPSKKSIKEWLDMLFLSTIENDGTISCNLYDQTSVFDIGRNTLSLLFTVLELQHGLLRATTPFYSSYQLKPSSNPAAFKQIENDPSKEARAIRSHWKVGKIWHTIDVVPAAEDAGLQRADLVRCISRWELNGLCEVKVAGVRNRYFVLKELPQLDEDIEELADQLFQQLHDREEADVKRLRSVVDFVRGGKCYAQELALYFGDEHSVPDGECGNCSFCKTRSKLAFEPKFDAPFSEKQIAFVMGVCGVRDDPRFLARLAFGVSSPRITALGLSKHDVFGCCDTADFTKLLARFEEECAKQGHKNRSVLAPPKQAATGGAGASGKGSAVPAKRGAASSSKGTSVGAKKPRAK
ncbi:ATP-dependent DNA helicase [Rhodotorula diobovata]|uniref:ATP-dependent DNA helicase n=1 Tax=Rhodotorula diobovata TaxID=5288 RepID=A0A5C5FVH6_9BASI|nr:ATP-dependent DNA helicase [Rhodotorula diobovata]